MRVLRHTKRGRESDMRAREGIEMDGAEPCLRASFLCVCSVLFVLSCRREGCLPPAWPGMDSRNYSDRRQTNGQVLCFSGLMTRRGIFGEYIIATTTNHHNCFFKTLSLSFFSLWRGLVFVIPPFLSFSSFRFIPSLFITQHTCLCPCFAPSLCGKPGKEEQMGQAALLSLFRFVSFRFLRIL